MEIEPTKWAIASAFNSNSEVMYSDHYTALLNYIQYHLGNYENYNVPVYIKTDNGEFMPLLISVQQILEWSK